MGYNLTPLILRARYVFRFVRYEDVADDDDNETTSPPRLIMMITGQESVAVGGAFNRDGICRNLTSNEGCRQ